MRKFSFENLKVWEKSRDLSKFIYAMTAKMPSEEKFGLISQMRRAAISVSSNIAEDSGRHSFKEKARFTEIAYSSGLELLNQAILGSDLNYISVKDQDEIRRYISEISSMLDGLYKSQIAQTT